METRLHRKNKIEPEYAATWHTYKGAKCPACGYLPEIKSKSIVTQRRIIDGNRVRYHKCPVCGYRFKSVEDCAEGNC